MITEGFHVGDNVELLPFVGSSCVDLVLTVPPYDELAYARPWNFRKVAKEIVRVLKPGGVVVWMVADQFINGSETCESMRQALGFRTFGLDLFETMICRWKKYGLRGAHGPFLHAWDFMFIFTKGRPNTINGRGQSTENVWEYECSEAVENRHLAMPDELVFDHILLWTKPGDRVLDPFSGTGTVPLIAEGLKRKWIGMELDPITASIATRRIDAYKDSASL